MTHKLIIEFPTEHARECFLTYLSDGGGEYNFMTYDEYLPEDEKHNIRHFDYSKAFDAWGYKEEIHGPDKLVKAE